MRGGEQSRPHDMTRRLSAGEVVVGLVVLALTIFVGSQIVTASPRSGSANEVRGLSPADSLSIAAQYQSQIVHRGPAYAAPAWLGQVQIARLQAAAERDLAAGQTIRRIPADSVAALLDATKTTSYLKAMLAEDQGLVMRWETRDQPIRVWIQPHSQEPGFASGLLSPVSRGFTAWNDLGLGVHFAMVEDSTVADVHVTWSAVMSHPSQIGTTFRMTGGSGWLAFAHVILSTSFDIYAVQNAARHEAGHVLGLGHSPDPVDIMTAMSEGRQVQITAADRQTAVYLYRLPAGALPGGAR